MYERDMNRFIDFHVVVELVTSATEESGGNCHGAEYGQ